MRLTGAQNGRHSHAQNAHTHGGVVTHWTGGTKFGMFIGNQNSLNVNTKGTKQTTDAGGGGSTTPSGNGSPHNNMQPSIVGNYIVKL